MGVFRLSGHDVLPLGVGLQAEYEAAGSPGELAAERSKSGEQEMAVDSPVITGAVLDNRHQSVLTGMVGAC